MKRNNLYSAIFAMSFILMSLACSSSDDNNENNDNSQEISQIISDMQSGIWIITSYIDSGNNETNDFYGYNFTFSDNGTLVATNDTITYIGTWSITNDSNSSDDSNRDIDFSISFPVTDNNDFEDLNDEWDIVSHNNGTMSLIDISGGDGSTDTLIFEKIN